MCHALVCVHVCLLARVCTCVCWRVCMLACVEVPACGACTCVSSHAVLSQDFFLSQSVPVMALSPQVSVSTTVGGSCPETPHWSLLCPQETVHRALHCPVACAVGLTCLSSLSLGLKCAPSAHQVPSCRAMVSQRAPAPHTSHHRILTACWGHCGPVGATRRPALESPSVGLRRHTCDNWDWSALFPSLCRWHQLTSTLHRKGQPGASKGVNSTGW